MTLSQSRRLRLAAKSSDAQMALTRDFGFGAVSHVEHRAQTNETSSNHLSRIQDRLRKEYDDVIPFAVPGDLRHLLAQLDLAA